MSKLDEMIQHKAESEYQDLLRMVEFDAIVRLNGSFNNPAGIKVEISIPDRVKLNYIEDYKNSFYVNLIYDNVK